MSKAAYGLSRLTRSKRTMFLVAELEVRPLLGVSKYPLLKEGQPRRSKNVTLPQSHQRGVGRSDNALLYDLPRFALAKVA